MQTILEKQIKAGGGEKDDLGRDAFLEWAWAWNAESGGTIVATAAATESAFRTAGDQRPWRPGEGNGRVVPLA